MPTSGFLQKFGATMKKWVSKAFGAEDTLPRLEPPLEASTPAPPSAPAKPAFDEQLRQLLEANLRQTQRQEELIVGLRNLYQAVCRLSETSRAQVNLEQMIRDMLSRLDEKREETTAAMHDIADQAQRQSDVLMDLKTRISLDNQNADRQAAELRKLTEALYHMHRQNEAYVEAMEGIRRNFVGSSAELTQSLQVQGRRLGRLLVTITVLLGVVLVVVTIRMLIGR